MVHALRLLYGYKSMEDLRKYSLSRWNCLGAKVRFATNRTCRNTELPIHQHMNFSFDMKKDEKVIETDEVTSDMERSVDSQELRGC